MGEAISSPRNCQTSPSSLRHLEMYIRILGSEDAREFTAMRLQALRDCPTAFASSYAEEVGTPHHEVESRLAPKLNGAVFGAFDDGRLIGICGVQQERLIKLAHKATVWGMYVDPAARRSGVGRALMQAVLTYAEVTLRVRTVRLGVNTENHGALSLYRRFSFRIVGTEERCLLIDEVFYGEHQMALDIN